MTNSTDDAVAAQRADFFAYFRKRIETIRREDIPVPERLVLASACLDALANHWHGAANPQSDSSHLKGTERMRNFLTVHGGHSAFERVSAPMLRNATGKEVGSFPFSAYRPHAMNAVRDWRHDPTFVELSSTETDTNLLNRWSYPGILYVDFRCALVHKFAGENADITLSDFIGRGEPHYRFVGNQDRFLLVFPLPFLVTILENCVESFEREATSRNILPFKA